MTRLEELTMNLADDRLTDREARELQVLLAQSEGAHEVHIQILQIEAGLRASRQNLDLAASIMARLRMELANSIAEGVMSEIRAKPMPEWRHERSSEEGFAGKVPRVLPFPVPLRGSRRALKPALIALAACVALLAALGLWYFGPTMGQPVLAEVQGVGLSLERAGQALPATPGTRLQPGDVLRTPENGTAAISFLPEKTRIVLNPGSEFKLASISRGKRFALHFGKLEASVARQRPFRPMVITTPQAEATVVGTEFTLSTTTNSTRLDVAEGKVRFARLSDGAAVKVPADHYAVIANATELAALPQTGGILREWWTNVSDQTMHDFRGRAHVRFPRAPDAWDVTRAFVLEPVKTNRLAVRFRGYLHPPVTGDYQIWLTGPADTALGETVLLVSPSEDATDATPIARTGSRPFTQSPPPFPLVAGRRYYLEALIFIEKGEGHLSLEWKRPAGSRELLTGEFLSPFKPKE